MKLFKTFRNKTHTSRWLFADSYSNDWKNRAIKLMDLFKSHEYIENSKNQVVEYGCGCFAPFYNLYNGKDGFQVSKYDLVAWDKETNVIDLNSNELTLPITNISVFSGVIEYLNDVPSILRKAIQTSDYLLISYSFVPSALFLDEGKFLKTINNRAIANGWRNHYTNKYLVKLFSNIGIISAIDVWNGNQSLFLIRNPKLDKFE